MGNMRMRIEARDCIDCGRTTPHEVHFVIERTTTGGVIEREIGYGCSRCAETAE